MKKKIKKLKHLKLIFNTKYLYKKNKTYTVNKNMFNSLIKFSNLNDLTNFVYNVSCFYYCKSKFICYMKNENILKTLKILYKNKKINYLYIKYNNIIIFNSKDLKYFFFKHNIFFFLKKNILDNFNYIKKI